MDGFEGYDSWKLATPESYEFEDEPEVEEEAPEPAHAPAAPAQVSQPIGEYGDDDIGF